MSANSSLSLQLRKILFVALLILICVLVIHWVTEENKPWIVPPEYKSLKNPLTPTESNLNGARQIYADQCAQCHGDRGKGDGPEARSHYPLPADLTDPKLLANAPDGDIFYQITQGRRPMPSYKRRLTEYQRWQLVLLVRSFSQPAGPSDSFAPLSKAEEKK
ncbi:MAG TPA: cytochrome c [Candidatus Acidoferrum sp.]|nr:cytochrome c [Candidatus Acidoferrum sp.]